MKNAESPVTIRNAQPNRSGFFIIFGLLLLSGVFFFFPHQQFQLQLSSGKPATRSTVLGSSYQPPQIYIYGGESGYSAGGVISLASTDEPVIQIGGYNFSGSLKVDLYQANDDALLDYLTHDSNGKQIKQTPDTSKIQYITSVTQTVSNNNTTKVLLPLSPVGIWFIKVTNGSTSTNAFIVRSHLATLVKEGDNQFIFWGQDFTTKKSFTDGVVILYNLQNSRKELGRATFSTDGIATAPISQDADVALVAQNDERALIPINLRYLNGGGLYSSFQPKQRNTRYFIFTDRPLYRPGDTVYFKAVLRDEDDVRYTIPQDQADVKVYAGYYYDGSNQQAEFEQHYSVSPDGTISGQYQIPSDATVGYRYLYITLPNQQGFSYSYDDYSSNSISFDVEYFRKPDATIDVSTPVREVISGDKTSFTITGSYYSGQSLAHQKVAYTIYSDDFYEYEYLADEKYLSQITDDKYLYYFGGATIVAKGEVTLDDQGKATVPINTTLPGDGKTKVFSIEATINDGSQNPAYSQKNLLVYAGTYGIYRKDTSWTTKVNTPLSLPVTLVRTEKSGVISHLVLSAKIHEEDWVSYQSNESKYPLYKKETQDFPQISATTDADGNATFSFTPPKVGSYTITVTGKDERGNTVSKQFYSYVSSEDYPAYTTTGNNDLTISADKQKYQPTDTATFTIYSYVSDRDVFFSMDRGRVNRYQIVHLNGHSATIQVPLVDTDIPNMYATVASFDDNSLNTSQTDISVSSDSKRLLVHIIPDSKTYGPGQTMTATVQTTDTFGNPVSADVALWMVDKAIFALSGSTLGDIFDTFWHERNDGTEQSNSLQEIMAFEGGMGGGCFVAGTKILMGDGTQKNIEDVKTGDIILTRASNNDARLVRAKVLKTQQATDDGYLIINQQLKITPDHIMWINNTWQEAGNIQVGDTLLDNHGKSLYVTSIEWQQAKIADYNLEIQQYHTFFADGIWVHNDKGAPRSVFKDTAYWNPSLHTDTSGQARVTIQLPDNLTTWTMAAVADTTDTRVGQTTQEVVVTKDVIVRPVLPNILRTGDHLVLSSLVQNFTNAAHTFLMGLTFDSGTVAKSVLPPVTIKPNAVQQMYWDVSPTKENDTAKLVFSAKAQDNANLSDTVVQEIPVRPFVFEDKKAQTGQGTKTYSIHLSSDDEKEKSQVILSLAPQLIGTLPTAMKYLVDYPYGCVEQTTSRFVPAVIAKANQSLYGNVLKDKNLDDIIQKGIGRLMSLQHGDGGWSWWYSGNSDSFISAYVVEYVQLAQEEGITIDTRFITQAKNYLEQTSFYDEQKKMTVPYSTQDMIAKDYALTLLGDTKNIQEITNFSSVSPDLVALTVMTNYLNGDTNPATNGLSTLLSMAKSQGDELFWEAGAPQHFGSRDASTALAVRAMLLAGGDKTVISKAVRYLTRSRMSDYWSNTFATAQVVRALTDYAKASNELTPQYTYLVALDGHTIAHGIVNSAATTIPDITIPIKSVKSSGSMITITQEGAGQLYSTLITDEFHTDRHAPAVNHGLTIKRQYINAKGKQYSLAVGDTVLVTITISRLKSSEYYGVITDELPAGLIPINQSFLNEQYNQDAYQYYYYSGEVTDSEVTENGVILSFYQLGSGERTFSYKARVVSEGTFIAPPVTVSLMYAPEIYGRSDVQTVETTRTEQILPSDTRGNDLQGSSQDGTRFIIKATMTILLLGVLVVLLRYKTIVRIIKKGIKRDTQDASTVDDTSS